MDIDERLRSAAWAGPVLCPVCEEAADEIARLRDELSEHDSDCATHNEPAYPNGPCDCSLAMQKGGVMDDKIAVRLEQLKAIGAGDEQCSDCMSIGGVPVMATCKQCIADTPAFTELVDQFMTSSRAAAAIAQEDK